MAWRNFGQPHRPNWTYAGFGPFVFDRDQYDRAVDRLLVRMQEYA